MTTIEAPLYAGAPSDAGTLVESYQTVRQATERLCSTLEIEDYGLQAMPDASPPKWHLAHVTWFFETFILKPNLSEYTTPNSKYAYLYNSYPGFPR